jgi:hypothetical protein
VQRSIGKYTMNGWIINENFMPLLQKMQQKNNCEELGKITQKP